MNKLREWEADKERYSTRKEDNQREIDRHMPKIIDEGGNKSAISVEWGSARGNLDLSQYAAGPVIWIEGVGIK